MNVIICGTKVKGLESKLSNPMIKTQLLNREREREMKTLLQPGHNFLVCNMCQKLNFYHECEIKYSIIELKY